MVPATPRATPYAASLDIRYVGGIPGRYTFPGMGERTVYSCRTASLSPTMAVLAAPVIAALGERVALRRDHVGLVNGTVVQRLPDGFRIELIGTDEDRRKLAAKINWLKKRSLRRADDKRAGARFQPKNPKGHLHVEGAEHDCFIIDLSVSGAALSARIVPAVGTAVIIGRVTARVVRHLEGGFGVQFDTPHTMATVEAEVTAERAPP